MVNLATKYLGLTLKNPIIVSSCSLTHSADGVKRCADAGASAVVLKSLFEEQINADVKALADSSIPRFHTEEWDYIQRMGLDMNADEYLKIIEESKHFFRPASVCLSL